MYPGLQRMRIVEFFMFGFALVALSAMPAKATSSIIVAIAVFIKAPYNYSNHITAQIGYGLQSVYKMQVDQFSL